MMGGEPPRAPDRREQARENSVEAPRRSLHERDVSKRDGCGLFPWSGLPDSDEVAVGIACQSEPSRAGDLGPLLDGLAAVPSDPLENGLDLLDEDVVHDLPGHSGRRIP